MKKCLNRGLSLLLCMMLCVGMFPAAGAEEAWAEEEVTVVFDPVEAADAELTLETTDAVGSTELIETPEVENPAEAVDPTEVAEPVDVIEAEEVTAPQDMPEPGENDSPAEPIDVEEVIEPETVVEASDPADDPVDPAGPVEPTEPAELPEEEPDSGVLQYTESATSDPVDGSLDTETPVTEEFLSEVQVDPPAEERITKGEAADEAEEEPLVVDPVRVVFNPTPASARVIVYTRDENGKKGIVQAEEDGSYLLLLGTYAYDVAAEGYLSVEGAELLVFATEEVIAIPLVLTVSESREAVELPVEENAPEEHADEQIQTVALPAPANADAMTAQVYDAAVTAPKITTQPISASVNEGATAKFTAAASGGGLSWQWQVYSTTNGTWVNSSISSAKTATLSFTAKSSQDGMKYRCRVSNSAGTVYSNAATLTVKRVAPKITAQPASITVSEGATAKFTAAASGSGLSWQWQVYSTANGTWVNSSISSAKTAALSFPSNFSQNGMKYRCRVSNSAGTVYSNAATLTVKRAAPKITTQPASITVSEGATAKFTAAASGSGLSWQWQVYSTANGSWVNSSISSAKTAALSFTAKSSQDGMKYRCRVSNSTGTVYSNAATLSIRKTAPTITTQPVSVSVTEGNSAKFSVSASGGGLSYQWQVYNASTGQWANSGISSAKTATLSFKTNTAHNGMKYRCRVNNSAGTVYSNQVTLTVKPVPSRQLTVTRVYAVDRYDEYYFGPSLIAEFEVTNPDEVPANSVVECIQFELQRCDNGTWNGMQQGVFWSNFRRLYDYETGKGTFIAELRPDCQRGRQYRFLYNFYAYGRSMPTETGYSASAVY